MADWIYFLPYAHFSFLGVHVKVSTIAELNQLIECRMFASWHDHASIASHSHYLGLISQLYDPLVYLTPNEYKG